MLMIVWVVLMIIWVIFGCSSNWDPAKPRMLGNTLIPWVCMLILGIVLFWGEPAKIPMR